MARRALESERRLRELHATFLLELSSKEAEALDPCILALERAAIAVGEQRERGRRKPPKER